MDYKKIIDDNKDLQVKSLQELVSIKSVVENPVAAADGTVYPFGQGVQDAFAYTLNLARQMGFKTTNIDNYGGHIDFPSNGNSTETVGIIGHLDVVPEGDNWSEEPYSGCIKDGFIIGRGTLDDKGPLLACLFAMKALKDAGYTPDRTVRLILGLDEETGWDGLRYYQNKLTADEMPDFGFTPDAEFPCLNGEKGIVNFEIAKKLAKLSGVGSAGRKQTAKGLLLSSLKGGAASNMVAEKARAVVRAENTELYTKIKEKAADFRSRTGYKLKTKGVGKSLEITTEGISAHGATPEKGLNAISIMMAFLGELNFVNEDLNEFIDFYNKHIGFEVNGQSMGCGFEDEKSGKLTFNIGLIDCSKEAITVTVNARHPVTNTADDLYEAIMPVISKYDMGVIKKTAKAPIYMEADSPMISAMTEIYAENTGDFDSKPLVYGGGTYARAFKNMVAFGALFPGDQDLMHQKDEKVSIDRYITATKIYADAIYKLSQKEFQITEE